MNKNIMKSIVWVLVVSLTVISCGGRTVSEATITPPPPTSQIYLPTATNEPPPDIYAGFTDDPEVPYIMVHQSGERLGVIQDPNSENVTGVVWISTNGESIEIYTNGEGMPQSAVVGDNIIQYSNYTSNTVDVTVIHADGTQETFQGELDTDLLNRISSNSVSSISLVSYRPSQHFQLPEGWNYMKDALYLFGAANCMTRALVPGIGIPLMAKACTGFILGSVIRAGNALDLDVGGLEDAKLAWDAINCVGEIDPFNRALACAATTVDMIEKADKLARQKIENPPSLFPASDISNPALDITNIQITVKGDIVEAIFYLKGIPTELLFQRNGAREGCQEYVWEICVDTDNNKSTGAPSNPQYPTGADYCLSASSFKFEDTPKTVSIDQGVQVNIWDLKSGRNISPATIEVDTEGNTIKLIGEIPGITNSSKFYYRTYDQNPGAKPETDSGQLFDRVFIE